MRYGILSDIHSNLEALDAVLAWLSSQRVDRLLCAGDLVGYGADPSRCLGRLQASGVQSVCGNHDRAVAGKLSLDWFNPYAQAALEWTARVLSPVEREYLAQLPPVWKDPQITVVHSTLEEPERFHYVLDTPSARRCLDLQETPLAFIGHTHVPGFFVRENGQVRFLRDKRIAAPRQSKILINVGSVGQPRDGDPRAACCLVDTDSEPWTVEIHRVAYPVEKAQAKIRAAGLPEFLAARLGLGY